MYSTPVVATPDWIVVDRDGIAVGSIEHWKEDTAARIMRTEFPQFDRGYVVVAWSAATDEQRRAAGDLPLFTLRGSIKSMDGEASQTMMERRPKRRPQAREQATVRRSLSALHSDLPAQFVRRNGGGH